MGGALARFRADPSKVRVGIRKSGRMWRATVREIGGAGLVHAFAKTPAEAIDEALDAADGIVPGIDLGMGSAYDHPWGVET